MTMSKTELASQMLQRSGIGSLLRKTSGHRGFIAFNYHRIGWPDPSELDHGVFSATPDNFQRQLNFLRNNCDVIGPEDIADLPRRGRGNYAMITFDDGYRDNYETAFPLLKAAGLKATFFVTTGFMEGTHLSWWDEIAWMVRHCQKTAIGPMAMLPRAIAVDHSNSQDAIDRLLAIYKKMESEATAAFMNELAEKTGSGRAPEALAHQTWMTWDMIREMRDSGMAIGGHTVTHPILSRMPRVKQNLEIAGCAAAIEQQLGQPMKLFSYPRGKPDAFNDDTRACLVDAGVQYAFTYYGGMNRDESMDNFDVRRVPVESDTVFENFEAMVTLPGIFA